MGEEADRTSDTVKDGDESLASKVDRLAKEVVQLRRRQKDAWDKAQILAAFLVPLAIAFAGYVFSQSTKQAEINISKRSARVAEAQLVQSFTDALTSPEPEKRKIAIEAVLLALPDDGSRLVQTIKEFDPDAGVRAFASQRLGTTDLFAQLVFLFDSYGDGPGMPPQSIFAEGAELEIYLKARGDSEKTFDRWLNGPLIEEPDTVLTTRRQTVDWRTHQTVDGASATQTNTFDRFQGDLGEFSDPSSWRDAKIEAIFRATSGDRWLLERRDTQSGIGREAFDRFYSVSVEQRRTWDNSDYYVKPLLNTRLEVFLGRDQVAELRGIVAFVWEHDEDVRNLHVARFARE